MTKHAINDKNYEHFVKVWKTFQMNTMKDYVDLYQKVDALLLACVFKTFRKESLNSYELDLAHYLSTPVIMVWIQG